MRNIQRTFNVQCTGYAGCCQASIIVHAVGDIGIFLQFVEHHTVANGMNSTGGDENYISGRDDFFMQQVFKCGMLYGVLNHSSRGGCFEPMNDSRTRFGSEDIPEFCFTELAAFILRRVGIVGMYLDGELRVRINKLCQQWKAIAINRDGLCAEQRGSQYLD